MNTRLDGLEIEVEVYPYESGGVGRFVGRLGPRLWVGCEGGIKRKIEKSARRK